MTHFPRGLPNCCGKPDYCSKIHCGRCHNCMTPQQTPFYNSRETYYRHNPTPEEEREEREKRLATVMMLKIALSTEEVNKQRHKNLEDFISGRRTAEEIVKQITGEEVMETMQSFEYPTVEELFRSTRESRVVPETSLFSDKTKEDSAADHRTVQESFDPSRVSDPKDASLEAKTDEIPTRWIPDCCTKPKYCSKIYCGTCHHCMQPNALPFYDSDETYLQHQAMILGSTLEALETTVLEAMKDSMKTTMKEQSKKSQERIEKRRLMVEVRLAQQREEEKAEESQANGTPGREDVVLEILDAQ